MRDVLPQLVDWLTAGADCGVATVVRTFRSAPRPPGAAMVVGPAAVVAGSVSGGCVEGAVLELAVECAAGAEPAIHRFGISDDLAFSAGLSCGGQIEVFVERVETGGPTAVGLAALRAAVDAAEPAAWVSVVDAPPGSQLVGRHLVVLAERPGETRRTVGTLGSDRLDAAVADDALGLLANGSDALLEYGPDGQRRGLGVQVFVSAFAPPPRLLVFGAIDVAAAVAKLGSFLGYRVTVCDARPAFASASRFPDADEVVVDWPHRYLAGQVAVGAVDERTALCVLTHDPKFDIPLLRTALTLPVGYVGAMGSRRTHEQRLERLRDEGVDDEALARLASPIGLDLGARTPAETAVSILAEIVARQWGGSGRSLSATAGPIHCGSLAARSGPPSWTAPDPLGQPPAPAVP